MLSTHTLTESINFNTFTFAAARLAYRGLTGIADDVERIQNATPAVLRGLRTVGVCGGYAAGIVAVQLVMFIIAAVRFILPALPVVAKAVALTAIPAVAMYFILVTPGAALCLVVFAAVTAVAAIAWK